MAISQMRLTLLQVHLKNPFVERAGLTPGTSTLYKALAGGRMSTM